MQLPAHSPVSIAALVAGLWATGSGGAAHARLGTVIQHEYQPRDLILTDSGTSALMLALASAAGSRHRLPAAAGHAVRANAAAIALPAWGCFDLGTAAVGAGVSVRMYDLDPATLGPDWTSLEGVLEAGVQAIVVVHWYGVPADINRVVAMAARYGAVVIDDAAQGVGASIGGRPVGTFGDLGILSFGRGKGRTGGAGGALVANTDRGQALLSVMRGAVRPGGAGLADGLRLGAQWALGRPAAYWLPASIPALRMGATDWHEPAEPRGISHFAAGALGVTWSLSADEAEVRRNCAERWRARLPELEFPDSAATGAERGELRLPVLAACEGPRARSHLLRAFAGAMPGYPALLASLPRVRRHLLADGATPGAAFLVDRLVTLPCHRFVNPED